MNEKTNVSKDATILLISKVLNMVIAMLSAMLLSRFRTLNEYGTYSQIVTVVNLATAIFMLGLPNSMNYFTARSKNEEERGKFISLYYNIVTIMCIIPFTVVYYNNKSIYDFWYVLVLLPWTQIVISGLSNMLVASGNTFRVLIFNTSRGISLLLLIFVIRFFNQSFYKYMMYYMCLETIFSIWVYIEAKVISKKWRFNFDIDLLKKVFKFSIPMGIASAIGTLSIQLDHLMVGRFFST